VLLLAANAWLCRRLFFAEYLDQLWSADGAFIAFARYIVDHYREMSWFPLWFCGMPYQDVYGPLLHHLVAAHAVVWRVSPAQAFHFSSALLYCLGPVTLSWLAWRLSGSRLQAFMAALVYTVFSPTALLIPQIRADLGGWFYLRRLHNLVIWGEAPHIAALVWIPLALLCLERRKLPASAVLMAAIALTNVTGTVGFAMAAVAWIVAKPASEYRGTIGRTVLAALLGYGLAMPWLPPTTVSRIVANSQASAGRLFPFTARHLLYFAALAALVALARWALGRAPALARFGALLAFISGAMTLLGFWTDIAIVPQPTRFQLEFEMGLALLLSALLQTRIPAALAAVPCLALLVLNQRHAGEFIRPIDIHGTAEYRQAHWFDRHMRGARVFAPGSVSLWMNIFTDTPQFAGCCDQGVPDWEQRVALHTIYRASQGPASVLWLQAYGVAAIAVSGSQSAEAYKPFTAPGKFEGLLPVLWREAGDTIYAVPRRSDSLARVIGEGDIVTRRPVHGLDTVQLQRYVAALNDPDLPPAHMQWQGPARARITVTLKPGQILSVQVAWHPGWRARGAAVERDALGLILIRPQCTGACTVDLVFDGGIEKHLARLFCALSLGVCLLLAVRGWRNVRSG